MVWRRGPSPYATRGLKCSNSPFGARNNGAVLGSAGEQVGAVWMGGIMEDQHDASGLLYRRNRYYDPATGRFTQEDPIGLAGGLNVYGFANGDPVTYSDPYGLMAQDCPPTCPNEEQAEEQGGINPGKMAVGDANMAIGTVKMAAGVGQLLGAEATAPVFFVSVPAAAAGTYNVTTGYGAVRRGAQQFSESLDDPSGPALKNVWGLAPFGQKYDDPAEPGPVQYFKGLAREFVSDPAAATKRAVREFFSFQRLAMGFRKWATKFSNWHSALEILFVLGIIVLVLLGVLLRR